SSDSSITVDFTADRFRTMDHSHTVLRAHFDKWLSERISAKGVFVIPKYRVDDLIFENGNVAGIKAGSEEIPANVVVAADGVLSFMAEKAGLKSKMAPGNYAVGMKEVVQLPQGTINDRFNVENHEGCAHLYAGDVTKGVFGGGFLYTNRESVSVGVVAGIQSLMKKTPAIEAHTLMESFKERYELKRLLDGGETVEYSAHIIPEAGYNNISKLYGNGILVIGDAAGFALNMGVTVRGMEFAIASGILAAETIVQAKERGDYSSRVLSSYEASLRNEFVLKDLETHKRIPEFIQKEDFFSFYPQQFPAFLEQILWFGEGPKEKIGATLRRQFKSSGMFRLSRLRDMFSLRKL
ncbi:MAG TPA: hypothetical protein VHO84_16480, partial [Syntrophorhabdaceae bacterium]|nr:hypothetical protein [Syntrophorhabdaceae bacterium]